MTVVWSGSSKTPLPGLSGEGWRYRGNALLDAASDVTATDRGVAKQKPKPVVPRVRCGCGRIASRGRERCWRCRELKRYA